MTLALALAGVVSVGAAESGAKKKEAKAYPLNVCLVSDEKLGGDMGDPFVFVHSDQQIKLCCKSCKKDFDKDSAKFIQKLAKAEKAQKEKGKK